jgi:hypothetical protein
LIEQPGVASLAWKSARRSKLERLPREAADFVERVSRRRLTIRPTRLILQPGEHALVEEEVVLYETRPYAICTAAVTAPRLTSPSVAVGRRRTRN